MVQDTFSSWASCSMGTRLHRKKKGWLWDTSGLKCLTPKREKDYGTTFPINVIICTRAEDKPQELAPQRSEWCTQCGILSPYTVGPVIDQQNIHLCNNITIKTITIKKIFKTKKRSINSHSLEFHLNSHSLKDDIQIFF